MDYQKEYERWLANVTPQEQQELLAISTDQKELADRFTLPLAFGTAGMRGTIGLGTYRMNLYTVRRATAGLAQFITELGEGAKQKGVLISYDTRRMSYEFALAAARVLGASNIRVYLFENVRPVPLCSFAIGHLGTTAGIMITASHNPKEYNGYKVYGDDGAQMSPEHTAKVVAYIDKADYFGIEEEAITVDKREQVKGLDNQNISDHITVVGTTVDEAYYQSIEKLSLSPDAVAKQGKNLRIVYTPIHGTGYVPVTTILKRMHIPYDVVEEQAMPDTEFSTVKVPNPEQPDALSLGIKLADKLGSDVVIGTDPDADRMGVAVRNDKGTFVLLNGNQIGSLLMDYILLRHTELGTLPANAAVVKTIVTTSLGKSIAQSYGVTCYDVLTGFKFIGEKINEWAVSKAHTFMFGYEESYGYLSGTHAKDKDAVVSAMLFAEMVCYYKDKGVSIYERLQALFAKHGYYTEKSESTSFPGLDGMAVMAKKMDALEHTAITSLSGYQVAYTDNYNARVRTYADGKTEPITLPQSKVMYYALTSGDWVCARPSGTEPKLKVYVSAKGATKEEADDKANVLIAALKEKFLG
jgi:phosphoglucomutase